MKEITEIYFNEAATHDALLQIPKLPRAVGHWISAPRKWKRIVGKTYKLKSWAKPRRDGTSYTGPKVRKSKGWRKHVRAWKAKQ